MIDGTTSLAGIVGWPVGHSRSPLIHNYWFALHGINGAYVPLPTQPDTLAVAIRGLQACGFRGVNVTAPYKETILGFADRVDETARRIGAANMLKFEGGQIIVGNTDSIGFIRALQDGAPQWQANQGPAVVLGAGGAARAVVSALIDQGVEEIRIINRSAARAQALQDHFARSFEIYGWDDAEKSFDDAALLINTTTLGMQGQPGLDIRLEKLPLNAVVTDLVYAPLETPLLASAHRRGMVAVDGLGMLLHQAAAAFALWFGVEPVVDAALRRHVSP